MSRTVIVILGALAGLLLGGAITGWLVVRHVQQDPLASFLGSDEIDIRHNVIPAGSTLDVEIDQCPTSACAVATPYFGTRVVARGQGVVQFGTDLPALTDGSWVRWRVFQAGDAKLLAKSSAEQVHVQQPPRPLFWVAWPAGGAAYGAAAGLLASSLWGVTATGAAILRRPQQAESGQAWASAPARPAAAVTTPAQTRVGSRFLVYDARSRLPIKHLRATSRQTGAPIILQESPTPGLYAAEHWSGEEIELRAAGYQTRALIANGGQSDVALEPQASQSRIRVLGGRSGSAIGGVPVEVVRGTETVLQARSDRLGDVDLGNLALQDDDLVQTALRTEGFTDARMRAKQAGRDGVLDLRVYYQYTPNITDQKRIDQLRRGFDEVLESWDALDLGLAAMNRFVAERCVALLEDPPSWGPLLIAGPHAPAKWLDALVRHAGAFRDFSRRLLSDPTSPALARALRPVPTISPTPTTGEPDLDQWMPSSPAAFQQALASQSSELRALRVRAAAHPSVPLRNFLQSWFQSTEELLRAPLDDRLESCARRIRAESQLQAIRWVLSDAGWAARLGR